MTDVTRLRLGYNNVYVVEGRGGRIAVDAGPDYEGAWDVVAGEAGALPGVVVVTHGHLDHAGLARRWQSSGSSVVLGAADVRLAAGPQLQDDREFKAFVAYVEAVGAPEEVAAAAVAGLYERREWARAASAAGGYPPAGRGGRWPTGLRYEPFVPDEVVEGEGEVADLKVLACPGHTPGNLVVLDEKEGLLFSGDQLLPDMTPTPGIQFMGGKRFRSLPAFAESLRRLRGLAQRCYPGHGEPFAGVDAAIETNLAGLEQRSARVLGSLRSEGAATVWGMSERLYPRAVKRRFWQIVATVQGQMDVLEAEGEVRAESGRYEVA